MKKLIFAFIAMTTMAMGAQNITDAVRYSTSELNGTARYRALSGAFGALGGDLSSLNVNPAGSAVFLRSVSSLSLTMKNVDNQVGYFNGLTNSSNSNIGLGQAGAALVFNNRGEDANWKKFTFGLNYSEGRNFNNAFTASGRNTNSIDNYFLGYANGIPLDLLEPLEDETVGELYSYLGENEGFGAQQALLGYQGFILNAEDPDDFEGTTYISAVAPGVFDQEYSYAATGLNGKFTFNFATQFQDNLYLGLNLNSHFLNYDRVTTFFEGNNNSDNETKNGIYINEIYMENTISTVGSGFSFQLGSIAKLGDMFRIGAAYETPTWYTISEETTQYLRSNFTEIDNGNIVENEAVVNPNVVNIYPEYKLQTPSKYTGSFAIVFGTQGLLSFDYSYKDYSSMKFKPTSDPNFGVQNDLMQNNLRGASTYRLGGEYRIEELRLRAGYRFEESPYKNETTIGNLNGYSLGLGYDFGNMNLGLSYDTAEQERNPQLFNVGLTDAANINRQIDNFTLTLSFGI